jgi:hypothetical protein
MQMNRLGYASFLTRSDVFLFRFFIVTLSFFTKYIPQDNDSFQAKFNALIELNQANRGDLVRSPTREKLAAFLERLSSQHAQHDDAYPTALWYFLTIHDSILHPLVGFLKWKAQRQDNEDKATAAEAASAAAAAAGAIATAQDKADADLNKRPASEEEEEQNFKRSKLVERS